MADRVKQPPDRRCSRDEKLCYYQHLEYDFLTFLALHPSFLIDFVRPYPGMFLFLLLRPYSRHPLLFIDIFEAQNRTETMSNLSEIVSIRA